jgi:hypothetical protein
MSVNPRTMLAWSLSVALMAANSPAVLAAGHGGGGFHGGGGGSFHGAASFHGGGGGSFHSAAPMGGNFSHSNFHSGSVGSVWHNQTPHIASRTMPNQFHSQSFSSRTGNWNAGQINHGNWNAGQINHGNWNADQINHGNWNAGQSNHGNWNVGQSNRGNWNHGNWNHSVWDRGGAFFRRGRDFDDCFRFGFGGLGLFGWGWWPGFFNWWPGYYRYYGSWPYYDITPNVSNSSDYFQTDVPVQIPTALETPAPMRANGEESEFYSQALAAFQEGDYGNATRLAGHAAIDNPKNPDVHMLISLGLFAAGHYRPAAMEAHAVAALGGVLDWPQLLALYNKDVDAYTKQLRALEKYVRDNPQSPDGRFLLGFQYMMDGHRVPAQDQFLESLRIMPQDQLAAQLLKKEGGTIPPEIAKRLESTRQPPPPPPEAQPGMAK